MYIYQHAKNDVTDSPGLVDFAMELVNCDLNLPAGQVKFFGKLCHPFQVLKLCACKNYNHKKCYGSCPIIKIIILFGYLL